MDDRETFLLSILVSFDFELSYRHSMVRSRQVPMTVLEGTSTLMPWEFVDFQLSSNSIKDVILCRLSFWFSFLFSFELPFKVEQKREPEGEHFVLFSVLIHRKRPQVSQLQTFLAAFVIACVCLDPGCRVRHSGLIHKSLISRFLLSLAAYCRPSYSPGSGMKRISRFRFQVSLFPTNAGNYHSTVISRQNTPPPPKARRKGPLVPFLLLIVEDCRSSDSTP
jgi:hypothetical protein